MSALHAAMSEHPFWIFLMTTPSILLCILQMPWSCTERFDDVHCYPCKHPVCIPCILKVRWLHACHTLCRAWALSAHSCSSQVLTCTASHARDNLYWLDHHGDPADHDQVRLGLLALSCLHPILHLPVFWQLGRSAKCSSTLPTHESNALCSILHLSLTLEFNMM